MIKKYLTIQEAVKLTNDPTNIRDIEIENKLAHGGTIPFYISDTIRFHEIDDVKIRFNPLAKQIAETEEVISNYVFQVEMLQKKIARLKEIKE